ncbi:MAG: sulfatase [Anaerolineales bacterium]|nr:sulfatase [Anaerolineales bacterium]
MSRPSILLITVDCLRADVLGCYGGPAATPHIDRLAVQGARFNRAFAHSSFTKTTFPSIFSSAYPSDYGGSDRFAAARPSLVAALRAAGYHTLGVNSNPWLSESFGYRRGYSDYADLSSATPMAHALPVRAANHLLSLIGGGLVFPPYPDAARVTDTAVSLLQSAADPFFLWVHYMDAHWPYNVARPLLYGPWQAARRGYSARLGRKARRQPAQVTPAERDALFALYLAGIATVDRHVGRLLAAAPADGVVLLTADHGEAFGEHGTYFHEHALHAENVRVPLLLRAPGVRAAAHAAVVRHLDVAPTLLDAAGAPPATGMAGVSLLPALRGGQALPALDAYGEITTKRGRWLSLRRGPHAAILLRDAAGGQVRQRKLYDHAADPAERHDLAASAPAVMQAMEHDLLAYAAARAAGETAVAAGDDAELQARLRALGYLE